tara:strand:- start:3717 stop:4022 length:306 start_codon:yes stop_codon:yes gene_type:complete
MKKKLNVQKVRILGQDYLVKSSESSNMIKITEYVNSKMEEVIKSGIDRNSQQLRIAIFACLEIAGELILYKEKKDNLITKVEDNSKLILNLIDNKLSDNKK